MAKGENMSVISPLKMPVFWIYAILWHNFLTEFLHSKSDRCMFEFSHIVIFHVFIQTIKKIFITSKTQSTHKAITNG